MNLTRSIRFAVEVSYYENLIVSDPDCAFSPPLYAGVGVFRSHIGAEQMHTEDFTGLIAGLIAHSQGLGRPQLNILTDLGGCACISRSKC